MTESNRKLLKVVRAAVIAVFAISALGFILIPNLVGGVFDTVSADQSQTRRPRPTPTPRRTRPAPRVDTSFTKFSHDVDAHQMSCDSCHNFPSDNWEKVRTSEAFPDITDYPKHESCVSCHREQFFKGPKPNICSICHTNPSPSDSARHPFGNPRELFDLSPKGKEATSSFVVRFPHEIHMGMMGNLRDMKSGPKTGFIRASFSERAMSETCAVCHQTLDPQGDADNEFYTTPPASIGDGFWLKKGTFKSSPLGHTQCFTCHSLDTGIEPAPSNCATCHVPREKNFIGDATPEIIKLIGLDRKVPNAIWAKRGSSATFRHEFFAHVDISCNTCHNTEALDTSTSKGRKVGIENCSGCHITATTDDGGILNFEIDERKKDSAFSCIKCHVGFGSQAIPATHVEAIRKLLGN